MDDDNLCLMCGANEATADNGLCSPCGFCAQHLHSIGFALVPTASAGVGCEACVKNDVCIGRRYAEEVGALIGACASRVPMPTKPDEPISPVQNEDAALERKALSRCKTECPHNGGKGELDHCKPQSFTQRLSYCSDIGKWIRALEC